MAWVRLDSFSDKLVRSTSYSSIIYWEIRDGCVFHQGRKLRSADPKSFEVRTDRDFIARDSSYVYRAWSKQSKIDRETFKLLNEPYSIDKNTAYCEYETSIKPLKGGNSKSFRIISHGFARDKYFAYYWGRVIKRCVNPLTLEAVIIKGVPSDLFIKDSDHVYFEGGALSGADVNSWEYLDNGFSRDKKNGYFGAKKIASLDISSWKYLIGLYSKDRKYIYVMNSKLPDADPETWEYLGGNYSKDKNQVYFVGRLVEGADPASFVVGEKCTANDKLRRYEGGYVCD